MKYMFVAVVLLLGGCATQESLLPKGYSGPTASISDSIYVYSARKADFFYVEAIDGQHIDNALEHTARVNQGRGLAMTPEGKGRPVATKETQFHIAGRTHFAAPILEMTGTTYFVDGDVTFIPVAEETYIAWSRSGRRWSWCRRRPNPEQIHARSR